MSERVTTNRKLEEKLDILIIKVERIEERLEQEPKISEQKDKNVDHKFVTHDKRITSLETNQRWVIIAILGVVVNAVMQLIIK